MDALAHTERVRIVKHLHLRLASFALVDGTHTWILLVQPTALHVGLLLWVVLLRVDLTDQVRDLLDSLLLTRANIAASKRSLGLLELSGGVSGSLWASLSEVIPVLSAEIACVMGGLVSGNHGAEALGCRLNWPVDQRELGDVVLVDHAEHWLLFPDVHFGVLDVLLIGRFQLTEAIIADQMRGLLLRFAIDCTQGCRQATRAQTVDIGLFGSFLCREIKRRKSYNGRRTRV